MRRIVGICKRSKQEIITRIEARGGDRHVGDLKLVNAEFTEPSDQVTIGQTSHRLLADRNLAYVQIVKQAKE